MEHPLIHGIENLTLEELGSKVSELYKKLAIAQRMGNGYLCDQINMALSSYSTKHQEKLNDLLKSGDRPGFDNKIDIS
jgi:hypothetical protein